jgi:hypothetical protein
MGELQRLGIHRFHSSEEVDMAVREWLRMQKKGPVSTATDFLNSCQGGNGASLCSGIMLKKDDSSVQ